MTYPTITASNADIVASELKRHEHSIGLFTDIEFGGFHTQYVKEVSGADVSTQKLVDIALEITSFVKDMEASDSYEKEELWAEMLHKRLSALPEKALQDPGFWRYLALFPFRGFLMTREPDMKPLRYGGGRANEKAKWLLPRAYIWGRKTEVGGDYALTHAVRKARAEAGMSSGTIIDFYHSHIVRTAWSASSNVAIGFVSGYLTEPVLFDESNDASRPSNMLAKAFARNSNNICLEFLSQDDLVQFAQTEKASFPKVEKRKDLVS
jgi:hypothetical protein